MKKVLVIIPAFNEETNILNVVGDINKNFSEADILVVNDDSKDNTEYILKKNNINYITHSINLGYSGAIQTGVKYAKYNNYEYALFFDGDGQHIASEAKKVYYKLIDTNADMVIGSRFKRKTSYKHPFFRKVGTKLFSKIIKLLCHKNIYDPTSGLQCINKKIINRFSSLGGYPEFPDANLIIELLYEGYKIKEVPVIMKENNTGKSMHSGIIKPIKYMVNVLYSITFISIKSIGGK